MKDNNNHYHVRNKSKSAKHKTPVNKKNKQFVNMCGELIMQEKLSDE